MSRIHETVTRIEAIKEELVALGDMRPGSLSVQKRRWGGEYVQLSYTHRGKGHTEYVRSAHKAQIERQVEAYRRFRELTKEWVDLSIELCRLRSEETSGSADDELE